MLLRLLHTPAAAGAAQHVHSRHRPGSYRAGWPARCRPYSPDRTAPPCGGRFLEKDLQRLRFLARLAVALGPCSLPVAANHCSCKVTQELLNVAVVKFFTLELIKASYLTEHLTIHTASPG